MENGWKMENGKRIRHPCVLLGSRGEIRQVAVPRRPLIQRFPQADIWPVWLSVVQLPDCPSSRIYPGRARRVRWTLPCTAWPRPKLVSNKDNGYTATRTLGFVGGMHEQEHRRTWLQQR